MAKIDRNLASKINPLISRSSSFDTLENVAHTLGELGVMLSKNEVSTEWAFMLTDTLAAALMYEEGQRHNLRAVRATEAANG